MRLQSGPIFNFSWPSALEVISALSVGSFNYKALRLNCPSNGNRTAWMCMKSIVSRDYQSLHKKYLTIGRTTVEPQPIVQTYCRRVSIGMAQKPAGAMQIRVDFIIVVQVTIEHIQWYQCSSQPCLRRSFHLNDSSTIPVWDKPWLTQSVKGSNL